MKEESSCSPRVKKEKQATLVMAGVKVEKKSQSSHSSQRSTRLRPHRGTSVSSPLSSGRSGARIPWLLLRLPPSAGAAASRPTRAARQATRTTWSQERWSKRWSPALATYRRRAVAPSTRAGMLLAKRLATATRTPSTLTKRPPAASTLTERPPARASPGRRHRGCAPVGEHFGGLF